VRLVIAKSGRSLITQHPQLWARSRLTAAQRSNFDEYPASSGIPTAPDGGSQPQADMIVSPKL